ncbi:MAG: hypothetical protein HY300_14130, partial [Verrucomicrobia bacterium]|nr:hypothetical protein [Verrucomicrobiota bacterium]
MIYSATLAGGAGKGWFGGVAEQFSHFGTVQDSGHAMPNEIGQHLDSSVSQVFAGYNLSDRCGLQFNLPLIHRSFVRPRDAVIDRGAVSGVGDVSLIGNYRVYQRLGENFTFNWSVLGGIKLPTGDSARLGEPDAPASG